jgi:glutathione reductase (NADPH)
LRTSAGASRRCRERDWAKLLADTRNLLEGNKYKTNFLGMASVVFTLPPLARIGMLEDDAWRQGLKCKVNTADIANWYSSRRVPSPVRHSGVLVEEGRGRILGAHLLGAVLEKNTPG